MEPIDESTRRELLQENINRWSSVHWPLKLLGFGRFEISDGQIKQSSYSSKFMGLLILIIVHSCTYYIIYEIAFKTDYLVISEVLIMLNFLLFHTCVLSNAAFVNRSMAAKFLNTSIELDNFLGATETMFMRDVTSYTYLVLSSLVGVTQLIILSILFFTYVVDFGIYISGAILFTFLYFIYYDLLFFLCLYTILTLRVRYLNVAIMKLANVKLEYLPKQFPFNSIFWNNKYDEMVKFHMKAETKHFTEAFIMIFKLLRYLENCYCFTIFCCLAYIFAGTFIIVQSWIIWAKSTNVDIFRILAMTGWCLVSWTTQIGLSQQTDMFQRQINQTTLICTFILLKPTYSDEIYELTASIIRLLEVRDPRVSIYGLFYFDTRLLLRISSSIFVYITMQLQIAFPRSSDNITANETTQCPQNITESLIN